MSNEGISASAMGIPMVLKLKDVLAAKNGQKIKLEIKDCSGQGIGTLELAACFEKLPPEATAAVGSDWVNAILRKGWIVMTDQIEFKVKEVVGEVLHKIRHPDPHKETGAPVEPPTALKIYADLLLENFELGQEPPSIFELKMLNTRSDQDLQLKVAIRWCASDNWVIKVVCKGNRAVPDLSIALTGLEVWMPLWIQARLAGSNTGLGVDVFEMAALEDPVIKLQVSTRAGVLPGGLNVDTILSWIRPKIRDALVLPNRIRVCLAKDPVSGLPLAADKAQVKDADQKQAAQTRYAQAKAAADAAKKSKAPDAGALQALADMHEGLIKMDWPKDKRTVEKYPSQALSIAMNKKNKYQYLCACSPAVQDEKGNFQPDPAGMPLYESVHDFKAKRLRLDDRQMRAVGRLSVKLIEAADLRDPDAWGTVDAFCEVQLLGTGNKMKSSTVFNDTGPVWSEFYDFLIVDEINEVLKFDIFDKDMFKDDFLGEVEIAVKELTHNKSGWRDGWFPLQKAPGGELHLGLCYRKFEPNDGPVASNTFVDEAVSDVTTRGLEDEKESPYKGKVMVTVQKAENLIKLDTAWSDDKGLDPYVVIDFGKQTKKTKVKDTLNPIWNETFGFDCKDGGNVVTITIKDTETLQKDREIGICRIPLDDLVERPGKKWAEAFTLKNPEDRQTCKNAKGFTSLLYLVIQYVEEGQPIPVEPLPMNGVDSDVLTRDLNSAVPVGPPKASLFLRVIKANDLPKMDFVTGKADPYVSVKLNGEGKEKTRTIEANLDPQWDEDFLYQMEQNSTQTLELTIKDYNMSVNAYMGEVKVPIKGIRDAKNIKAKVYPIVDKKGAQLMGKSGKPSTLTCTMEWKDASSAPAAPAFAFAGAGAPPVMPLQNP